MVAYPLLPLEQQGHLPKLKRAAQRLPVLFEDSTHHLWQCDSDEGLLLLKVCNQTSIEKSTFWHGMNLLFNADFPASLGSIGQTYQQLDAMTPLTVPTCITSQAMRFILCHWLEGDNIEPEKVTENLIIDLADHLGQLHQHSQKNWGPFHQPKRLATEWPLRLHHTIATLAKNHRSEVPTACLDKALQQATSCQVKQFVPVMPDLRWDQFLQQGGRLSALLDVDAVVYGPREIDFVLLEYLLNAQQAQLFSKYYRRYQPLPDMSAQRHSYRVLLFLMNVLGEQDLNKWLAQPYYW